MWEFKAEKSDRLDRSLREQAFTGAEWLSRQSWDWLILNGAVSVNGRKALKAGASLAAGDVVRVDLPGELGLLPSESAEPIWTAKDWAVFNKPAGIDTLPHLPWDQTSFASCIEAYARENGLAFASLAHAPNLEGGLVQRLDRDTSGLVCAAFSEAAKTKLRDLFGGKVEKIYDALVTVQAEPGEHKIWLAAESGPRVRAYPSEPKEKAEEITLTIEVYKSSSEGAWLRVRTRQGRRHVVRAGLAALGAPLLGDTLYGGDGRAAFHQLHAAELEFPFTREWPERITVSPPQSFLDSAATLALN